MNATKLVKNAPTANAIAIVFIMRLLLLMAAPGMMHVRTLKRTYRRTSILFRLALNRVFVHEQTPAMTQDEWCGGDKMRQMRLRTMK